MSQENVEFMEALVTRVGGTDQQAALEALPELIAQTCAPDIDWVQRSEALNAGGLEE
jgi:hypothetical protein